MVDAGQIKLAVECQAREWFEADTMSQCKLAWSWCTRQGSGQVRHVGTAAVPLLAGPGADVVCVGGLWSTLRTNRVLEQWTGYQLSWPGPGVAYRPAGNMG